MARPTKLTPAAHATLVKAIGLGATQRLACAAVGVDEASFCTWMIKAREGKSPYRELLEDLEKTRAESALRWLASIEAAAEQGTWTASAWKLERLYPREYGRQIHEHSGADGTPLQIVLTRRSGEGT